MEGQIKLASAKVVEVMGKQLRAQEERERKEAAERAKQEKERKKLEKEGKARDEKLKKAEGWNQRARVPNQLYSTEEVKTEEGREKKHDEL